MELGKAMAIADAACMHKYSEPFSEDIIMAGKKVKVYQLAISQKTTIMDYSSHIVKTSRKNRPHCKLIACNTNTLCYNIEPTTGRVGTCPKHFFI